MCDEEDLSKTGKFEHLEKVEIGELVDFQLTDSKLKFITKPLLTKLFLRLQGYIKDKEEDLHKIFHAGSETFSQEEKTEQATPVSTAVTTNNNVNCTNCSLLLGQLNTQTEKRFELMEELCYLKCKTIEMGFRSTEGSVGASVLKEEEDCFSQMFQPKLKPKQPECGWLGSSETVPVTQQGLSLEQNFPALSTKKSYAASTKTSHTASSKPATYYKSTASTPEEVNMGLEAVKRPLSTQETDGLFVTRCSPQTDAETVSNFIKRHTGHTLAVIPQKTKFDWYSSFQVKCGSHLQEKLLSGSFWPKGMLVKPFFVRRKPVTGTVPKFDD